MDVERTTVNPWSWLLDLGYNQAGIGYGQTRTLYCAGQTAMWGDGKPSTPVTWRRG
ncbi:hypothetical protein [Kribbella sp. NPDC049584]|uniref:hypothetical protein n=1 Tax=Kribbella sp. NPDC049584 TaxID=3154833 RepID=UPI003448EA07